MKCFGGIDAQSKMRCNQKCVVGRVQPCLRPHYRESRCFSSARLKPLLQASEVCMYAIIRLARLVRTLMIHQGLEAITEDSGGHARKG